MNNIFIKATAVIIIAALIAAVCVLWIRTSNLSKTISEQKEADSNIITSLNNLVSFINKQIEAGTFVVPPPEQPTQ